ncbi:MAG: chromate transporter [Acholeplasmataceae bacterium]
MEKKHSLWELFITFFKIGAVTFGGGYAMMPIMHREVVEKKHWVEDDDVIKMLVISESTPGVFAINSATFIGYKIAKFKGALFATLGVVIPSLITISVITVVLNWFQTYEPVQFALKGIQVGAAIVIFNAAFKLSSKLHFNLLSILVLIAAFLISLLTSFSVIYIILCSALIGIIIGLLKTLKKAGEDHAA